jgi:hypothetical protein
MGLGLGSDEGDEGEDDEEDDDDLTEAERRTRMLERFK